MNANEDCALVVADEVMSGKRRAISVLLIREGECKVLWKGHARSVNAWESKLGPRGTSKEHLRPRWNGKKLFSDCVPLVWSAVELT